VSRRAIHHQRAASLPPRHHYSLEGLVGAAADSWQLIINVGGHEFRTRLANLHQFPRSRLGRIVRSESWEEVRTFCDGFIPGDPPTVFFDRRAAGRPTDPPQEPAGLQHGARPVQVRRAPHLRAELRTRGPDGP
jgi:hypothetical protein